MAGGELTFVTSLKYLGLWLITATHFKCSVEHVKVKIFRVFNCIFSRFRNADSGTVKILTCLPFQLYGSEAVTLSAINILMLDRCTNRALYSIFGIGDKENIWHLRQFLGLHSIRQRE